MRIKLIMSAMAILLITACSDEKKTEGTVLATVNGEILTLEELVYQVPSEFRSQLNAEGMKDVVESWVNTELLYQKALEKGIDLDPQIQAIIKAGTREAIARKLVDDEMSLRTFIPPTLVDSIYNAQRETYKLEKDRYRASHILVQTKGEADAVYSRLKTGVDFAVLARDYSVDRQSAERGGDLGYFTAEDIDPNFVKAADKLKVGSYSGPVQTPYGYHLILLTDRQKAGADLDSLEAKQRILDDLYSARHAEAFQGFLDELKSTATIERFALTDSLLINAIGQGLP